jgi:type III pantothenate kinase
MRTNRSAGGGRFLVVDLGNTTAHFGICDSHGVRRRFRVASDERRLLRDVPRLLAGASRPPLSGALISSVVPRLNPAMRKLCRDAGIRARWLDHRTAEGVPLRYPRPEEVGADRIANAAAAHELYGGPAIVVDMGTALTFDCVSRDGAYLGGVIAPGPVLMCAALAERTGLLPQVRLSIPSRALGRTTVHAIRSGAVFGARAIVEGIVAALGKDMRCTPKIIFTGGQFPLIARGWKYPRIVNPLLTLEGLRIIYCRLRVR